MAVRNLVILTGAGISAESGVPTFRGADGLWEGHRFEDVATPEAFERDPALVQRFYNLRRAALPNVQPNAAHHALARLAAEWDGDFLLVTQNVDDLHDRALAEIQPAPGFELIVWFGEMPLQMDRIEGALSNCDLFVSIGTSGAVYPAAGFVQEARFAGAQTLELNLEPSLGAGLFDQGVYGPATMTVPGFVDRMLAATT